MSQTPNDIELIVRHYVSRYRHHAIVILIALLVLWGLSSTLYSVGADSEGVVLRFGKYSRTTEPGLHGKLPWPIETAIVVPVQKIQSLEFGFGTLRAGRDTQYAAPSQEQATIARMLTGDLNLAHVEWIIQYRIKHARNYLFRIGGDRRPGVAVDDAIRDVAEAAMRKLVGNRSVDEVITKGREEIANVAKNEVQMMLDNFQAGVDVVTVKLQSATPPEEVKDAFDAVNRARQNKERVVNDARGERNRQIPAARGQRDRIISEAEGYRERMVREMQGRANAFLAQLAEFEKAPEVTRMRLYLEAMEQILSNVDEKTVIDESVRGLVPLLNLDAQEVPTEGRKGGAK